MNEVYEDGVQKKLTWIGPMNEVYEDGVQQD